MDYSFFKDKKSVEIDRGFKRWLLKASQLYIYNKEAVLKNVEDMQKLREKGNTASNEIIKRQIDKIYNNLMSHFTAKDMKKLYLRQLKKIFNILGKKYEKKDYENMSVSELYKENTKLYNTLDNEQQRRFYISFMIRPIIKKLRIKNTKENKIAIQSKIKDYLKSHYSLPEDVFTFADKVIRKFKQPKTKVLDAIKPMDSSIDNVISLTYFDVNNDELNEYQDAQKDINDYKILSNQAKGLIQEYISATSLSKPGIKTDLYELGTKMFPIYNRLKEHLKPEKKVDVENRQQIEASKIINTHFKNPNIFFGPRINTLSSITNPVIQTNRIFVPDVQMPANFQQNLNQLNQGLVDTNNTLQNNMINNDAMNENYNNLNTTLNTTTNNLNQLNTNLQNVQTTLSNFKVPEITQPKETNPQYENKDMENIQKLLETVINSLNIIAENTAPKDKKPKEPVNVNIPINDIKTILENNTANVLNAINNAPNGITPEQLQEIINNEMKGINQSLQTNNQLITNNNSLLADTNKLIAGNRDISNRLLDNQTTTNQLLLGNQENLNNTNKFLSQIQNQMIPTNRVVELPDDVKEGFFQILNSNKNISEGLNFLKKNADVGNKVVNLNIQINQLTNQFNNFQRDLPSYVEGKTQELIENNSQPKLLELEDMKEQLKRTQTSVESLQETTPTMTSELNELNGKINSLYTGLTELQSEVKEGKPNPELLNALNEKFASIDNRIDNLNNQILTQTNNEMNRAFTNVYGERDQRVDDERINNFEQGTINKYLTQPISNDAMELEIDNADALKTNGGMPGSDIINTTNKSNSGINQGAINSLNDRDKKGVEDETILRQDTVILPNSTGITNNIEGYHPEAYAEKTVIVQNPDKEIKKEIISDIPLKTEETKLVETDTKRTDLQTKPTVLANNNTNIRTIFKIMNDYYTAFTANKNLPTNSREFLAKNFINIHDNETNEDYNIFRPEFFRNANNKQFISDKANLFEEYFNNPDNYTVFIKENVKKNIKAEPKIEPKSEPNYLKSTISSDAKKSDKPRLQSEITKPLAKTVEQSEQDDNREKNKELLQRSDATIDTQITLSPTVQDILNENINSNWFSKRKGQTFGQVNKKSYTAFSKSMKEKGITLPATYEEFAKTPLFNSIRIYVQGKKSDNKGQNATVLESNNASTEQKEMYGENKDNLKKKKSRKRKEHSGCAVMTLNDLTAIKNSIQ